MSSVNVSYGKVILREIYQELDGSRYGIFIFTPTPDSNNAMPTVVEPTFTDRSGQADIKKLRMLLIQESAHTQFLLQYEQFCCNMNMLYFITISF